MSYQQRESLNFIKECLISNRESLYSFSVLPAKREFLLIKCLTSNQESLYSFSVLPAKGEFLFIKCLTSNQESLCSFSVLPAKGESQFIQCLTSKGRVSIHSVSYQQRESFNSLRSVLLAIRRVSIHCGVSYQKSGHFLFIKECLTSNWESLFIEECLVSNWGVSIH